MKIVTVCALGYGTSVLLKVNAEHALATLGIRAEVEAVDLARARHAMRTADVVLTTSAMVPELGDVPVHIIAVDNLLDLDEIRDKLSAACTPSDGEPAPQG